MEPTSGVSGKTKDGESLLRRVLIADLRLRILEVKNCEKELQSSRFSASVLQLSLDEELRSDVPTPPGILSTILWFLTKMIFPRLIDRGVR